VRLGEERTNPLVSMLRFCPPLIRQTMKDIREQQSKKACASSRPPGTIVSVSPLIGNRIQLNIGHVTAKKVIAYLKGEGCTIIHKCTNIRHAKVRPGSKSIVPYSDYSSRRRDSG
jgi:hypothetical protein